MKVVGAVATGLIVFGPGSVKEKAQTLVISYGIGTGVEFVAAGTVGAELAGLMVAVIPVVLMLPDDQGDAYHEAQARAEAQNALYEELNGRAVAIYYRELGKGYAPEWNFVLEQAIHEKYLQLGLDKADAAHQQARKKMLGDSNPNACSKYDRRLNLSQPTPIYNGPRMSAY
jgi:hypothetical protein